MDDCEKAQERDALNLQESINVQRQRASAAQAPKPSGECHNPHCGEDLEGEKLFCNANCATEYEKFNKFRK